MDYVRTEPLRWRVFQFKEISYAQENKFRVDGLACKKKYIKSYLDLLLEIDPGDKRNLTVQTTFRNVDKKSSSYLCKWRVTIGWRNRWLF